MLFHDQEDRACQSQRADRRDGQFTGMLTFKRASVAVLLVRHPGFNAIAWSHLAFAATEIAN
jgi:hypothetical protein